MFHNYLVGLCHLTYNLVYLALAIVSAVVVFLIVFGGIRIIGRGAEDAERGKSMIKNAIWGLIIILIISAFGCYVAGSLNFSECVPCPWEAIYRPPPAWGEYLPVRVNITQPNEYDVFENGTLVNFRADIFDGYPYFDCIWNFNDGTPTSGQVDLDVRSCMDRHAFDLGDRKFMEYRIDVVVVDDWQFKAKDSVNIYVVAPDFVMVDIIRPEADKRPLSLGYANSYAGYETEFQARVISVASSFNYEWDFGDGTTLDSGSTSDNIIDVTHTFSNPGLYEVRLDVTDNNGNTGNDTLFVYVMPGACPTDIAYEFIHLKLDPDDYPPEIWEFHFTDNVEEEPYPLDRCTFSLTEKNFSDEYSCGIMITNEVELWKDQSLVVWVRVGATIDGETPLGDDADNLHEDIDDSNYMYCPDCDRGACKITDNGRCDSDTGDTEDVLKTNYRDRTSNSLCGEFDDACSDTCPDIGNTECRCDLSTSNNAYRPKYAILCGTDGRWYPCITPCCQGDFACTDEGRWVDCSASGMTCVAGVCTS